MATRNHKFTKIFNSRLLYLQRNEMKLHYSEFTEYIASGYTSDGNNRMMTKNDVPIVCNELFGIV